MTLAIKEHLIPPVEQLFKLTVVGRQIPKHICKLIRHLKCNIPFDVIAASSTLVMVSAPFNVPPQI